MIKQLVRRWLGVDVIELEQATYRHEQIAFHLDRDLEIFKAFDKMSDEIQRLRFEMEENEIVNDGVASRLEKLLDILAVTVGGEQHDHESRTNEGETSSMEADVESGPIYPETNSCII